MPTPQALVRALRMIIRPLAMSKSCSWKNSSPLRPLPRRKRVGGCFVGSAWRLAEPLAVAFFVFGPDAETALHAVQRT